MSFYAFAKQLDGVCYEESAALKLAAMEELSNVAGWILPFSSVVICCRRPITKWTDGDFDRDPPVLHCADGPSVEFADGWKQWHWRGTQVPQEWIETPDKVDPKTALTHPNVEQRRCLAEILGWDRVLAGLDTKVLDEDRDPQIGTLLEVVLPESGPTKFLRVRCTTERDFVFCVPKEMTTALQANAWMDPEFEGNPEQLRSMEFRT